MIFVLISYKLRLFHSFQLFQTFSVFEAPKNEPSSDYQRDFGHWGWNYPNRKFCFPINFGTFRTSWNYLDRFLGPDCPDNSNLPVLKFWESAEFRVKDLFSSAFRIFPSTLYILIPITTVKFQYYYFRICVKYFLIFQSTSLIASIKFGIHQIWRATSGELSCSEAKKGLLTQFYIWREKRVKNVLLFYCVAIFRKTHKSTVKRTRRETVRKLQRWEIRILVDFSAKTGDFSGLRLNTVQGCTVKCRGSSRIFHQISTVRLEVQSNVTNSVMVLCQKCAQHLKIGLLSRTW